MFCCSQHSTDDLHNDVVRFRFRFDMSAVIVLVVAVHMNKMTHLHMSASVIVVVIEWESHFEIRWNQFAVENEMVVLAINQSYCWIPWPPPDQIVQI